MSLNKLCGVWQVNSIKERAMTKPSTERKAKISRVRRRR
jgi:hypothetical protein